MDRGDDLVVQAKAGDREALRGLLAEHGPPLVSWIAREIPAECRSVLSAEDVLQQSYADVAWKIHSLKSATKKAFVAWLRKVAENNLNDACKGLTRQKRGGRDSRRIDKVRSDGTYLTLLRILAGSGTSPSDGSVREEVKSRIHEAIDKLPRDQARVVTAMDLEGKSVGEVATELSRTPGAVHMLRARAYNRLREGLGHPTAFFTDSA